MRNVCNTRHSAPDGAYPTYTRHQSTHHRSGLFTLRPSPETALL